VAGRPERTHDELAADGEVDETVTAQVTESALDPMAEDRGADGSTDHEPHPSGRLLPGTGGVSGEQVDHEGVAPAAAPTAGDAA
jgi:hypothetical protein